MEYKNYFQCSTLKKNGITENYIERKNSSNLNERFPENTLNENNNFFEILIENLSL